MEFGTYRAGKDGKGYGPYNWRQSDPLSLTMYLDAIERHILRLRDGEDVAPDSLVHHLGHIIADCSIMLDCIAIGNLKDDRPKPGPAAKLLDQFEQK